MQTRSSIYHRLRKVRVQLMDREFEALAEPITDPVQIASFLEVRRLLHPDIIRPIMLFKGVSQWANGLA